LFQLLPHGHSARFLNQDLSSLPVDLYESSTWKRFGWSVISDASFRARYASGSTGPKDSSSPEERLRNLDAYLDAVLKRAKKFHEALDAVSNAPVPVRMLALGGDCEETLSAPILYQEKNQRWVTLIRPRDIRNADGRKISKRDVTNAMYAPGDGRVTRNSLLGEANPDFGDQMAHHTTIGLSYAVFGCDLHGQLQRNKTLQDNALTALVSEAMR
jgi:hypothetical protein